jgi:hypothetical protein
VLSTTTSDDVFRLTSGLRALRGPANVFNPQNIGNVPSTFRWNPVEGCDDPATAIRRAVPFERTLPVRRFVLAAALAVRWRLVAAVV